MPTQVSAQLKNNSNALMHVKMSKELSSNVTFEGNTYDIQPGKAQKLLF